MSRQEAGELQVEPARFRHPKHLCLSFAESIAIQFSNTTVTRLSQTFPGVKFALTT